MAHAHVVYDNDTRFIIDPVTRNIRNTSGKAVIVQYDHNSERFTFEIPKNVDGHDMSTCNRVEIHFNNKGTGAEANGVYRIEDNMIDTSNANAVICTWLISSEATQYAGPLRFSVRYMCVTENDGKETVDYAWSTATYSEITIMSGIYNGTEV